MLVESNYPLNEVQEEGLTALMMAASLNDNKLCQCLVRAGADVNIISPNGNSCLLEAVRTKNKSLTRYFLK